MAVRTNDEAVKGILLSDYGASIYEDNPDLDPFIVTASTIVDRINSNALINGYALTSGELELIERWLAAHCYVMSDQAYSSNKTLDGSAVYQGETRMRLEASKYGQMALVLDWTGELLALGRLKRARIDWLGKYPSDQIAYRDKE